MSQKDPSLNKELIYLDPSGKERKGKFDPQLHSFIKKLWRLDIEVGEADWDVEKGTVWIVFPIIEEMIAFLNTVGKKLSIKPSSLYQHITSFDQKDSWDFGTFIEDCGGEDDDASEPEACFHISTSIIFPQGDLKKIEAELQRVIKEMDKPMSHEEEAVIRNAEIKKEIDKEHEKIKKLAVKTILA